MWCQWFQNIEPKQYWHFTRLFSPLAKSSLGTRLRITSDIAVWSCSHTRQTQIVSPVTNTGLLNSHTYHTCCEGFLCKHSIYLSCKLSGEICGEPYGRTPTVVPLDEDFLRLAIHSFVLSTIYFTPTLQINSLNFPSTKAVTLIWNKLLCNSKQIHRYSQWQWLFTYLFTWYERVDNVMENNLADVLLTKDHVILRRGPHSLWCDRKAGTLIALPGSGNTYYTFEMFSGCVLIRGAWKWTARYEGL